MTFANNWRQFRELVLLPGLAALLPWNWCFRLYRRLARSDTLYQAETEAALRGASSWQSIEQPDSWKAAFRLVRLVDHADLYLSLFRSDRWMTRHIEIVGSWPKETPFLAVTYHWGQGMWSLRHLRAHGIPAALLVFTPSREDQAGQPVAYWYGVVRHAEVERVLKRPVIDSAEAVWEIRRLWREGVSVVALYDVPRGVPGGAQARRRIDEVLGRQMDFPVGLAKLAGHAGVPVACFDCSVNRSTGKRRLRIQPALNSTSEDALGASMVRGFEALLREDLAGWHLNGHVAGFLTGAESTAQAGPP
jgi:hypothetical protein